MSIKDTLTNIWTALTTNRQVGHTTAMMEGAKNTEGAVILVHNHKYGQELKKDAPEADVVALEDTETLMGRAQPLCIDNKALADLCRMAAGRIADLEERFAQEVRDHSKTKEKLGRILSTTASWLPEHPEHIGVQVTVDARHARGPAQHAILEMAVESVIERLRLTLRGE